MQYFSGFKTRLSALSSRWRSTREIYGLTFEAARFLVLKLLITLLSQSKDKFLSAAAGGFGFCSVIL
jgi:hypothetical protein